MSAATWLSCDPEDLNVSLSRDEATKSLSCHSDVAAFPPATAIRLPPCCEPLGSVLGSPGLPRLPLRSRRSALPCPARRGLPRCTRLPVRRHAAALPPSPRYPPAPALCCVPTAGPAGWRPWRPAGWRHRGAGGEGEGVGARGEGAGGNLVGVDGVRNWRSCLCMAIMSVVSPYSWEKTSRDALRTPWPSPNCRVRRAAQVYFVETTAHNFVCRPALHQGIIQKARPCFSGEGKWVPVPP